MIFNNKALVVTSTFSQFKLHNEQRFLRESFLSITILMFMLRKKGTCSKLLQHSHNLKLHNEQRFLRELVSILMPMLRKKSIQYY